MRTRNLRWTACSVLALSPFLAGTSAVAAVAAVAAAAAVAAPAQTPAASAAEASIPAPADVAAPPADATVTPSGLALKVLQPGTGSDHPLATDKVKVHYTGWTTDGKMFDSSVARGRPALFELDKVIAGWTEGVQLMVAGETRRFWIPEALAYKGQREPKGMLVFDVELIKIE
jgi:peptidylprolyl isomerase